MNNWYVANDNGDIIGQDLSEEKAKLLAAEMRAVKTYYIEYYDGADNGIVSYDNTPGSSLDNALTFDTEEEAVKAKDKLQEEWKSELRVAYTSDESWEASREIIDYRLDELKFILQSFLPEIDGSYTTEGDEEE